MKPYRRLAIVAFLGLFLGGCGGGGAGGGAGGGVAANGCGAAVNERLDPRSTIHLFGSATEPRYLTDPPTSGPHRPGLPYRGVVATAIPRPSQVAMLESGFVIVQYRASLAPDQVAILAGLADALVTVAPPAGALPAPVVVTAWTWKLQCGSAAPAAIAAIRAFAAAHRGVGFPGNAPATTLAP